MKKKDLKKYLLPLVYFFLLATCLITWFLGGPFIIAMMDVESFFWYYKLSEWGITIFELKLLPIIALVIISCAWYLLGILVERKFNIHLFPNFLLVLSNRHRVRTRPNLLKVISRKKKLSKDGKEKKVYAGEND